MKPIQQSCTDYEAWLRAQIGPDFVERDLVEKHRKMKDGPFPFLRATYWRWAERILEDCEALSDAPAVLGIGDLHLENFGAFKGNNRLVYFDLNDFDESALAPATWEVVRLVASIFVAFDSLEIEQEKATRVAARTTGVAARARLRVSMMPRGTAISTINTEASAASLMCSMSRSLMYTELIVRCSIESRV